MIPTWMIEEIEQRRRERERRELPQLRIELPRPLSVDEGARRRPAPAARRIEPGEPARRAPADPIVIEYASAWSVSRERPGSDRGPTRTAVRSAGPRRCGS
jgi:hypothetical protein